MNTKTMLMVLSFALSIGTGLVLARGGGESAPAGASGGKILIGLSMDTLKEARWQVDRDAFVAKAGELGADVLVQAANSDDTRQITDIEGLISRKVSVLVVIPHDGTAMAKAVRLAHEAMIPIIAYDRLIRDSDLDLYVTFDNLRVGELQARFLVDHLPTPGKGKIVRIYGSKADNNASLYKQGQDRILSPLIERGDIKVIHEDWADDWKPEAAKKIVNAAITAHKGGFDAVLASNDGTAGGAIQALLEEGLAGKVLVTGQDAELVACQRIVAGTQAMTIYKPVKKLAARAAELAFRMANKRVVVAPESLHNGMLDVPSIFADVVVVTRDNMLATVVADGFQKREDIYGAGP